MIKKFVSMATASILLVTGLSVIAAAPASATTAFQVSCTGLTSESIFYIPMTAGTVDVNFDSSCSEFATMSSPASGLVATSKTNASNITSNIVRPVSASSAWSVTVTGTAVSQPNSEIGNATVVKPGNIFGRIVFVIPEFFTDANLGSLSIGTLSPTFAANVTSYTATSSSSSVQISAAAFASKIGLGKQRSALVSATCDSNPVTLTFSTSTVAYSGTCTITTGTTKNIVVRVTALDGSTTKDYTVAVTVSSGGGGGGGGGGGLPACNADLLSSSSTIKGVPITLGQSRSSAQFSSFYSPGPLRGSVNLTEAQATGTGATSITTTNGSPVFWLYIAPGVNSFSHQSISGTSNQINQSVVNGRDFIIRVVPTTCAEQYYWVTITVGSSSSTSSQAALAAAFTAALAKAAEVVKAKTALTSLIAGNKPATPQEFANADFKVRNSNVAEKVSAAMMKLSVADRENTQKINEIINLEDFLDRVSVVDTRSTVQSRDLISRGLLSATSAYKFSVVRGLASYPRESLDSMEKIDAAVKEQIFKAEAPKRRLAEIRARIAARRR